MREQVHKAEKSAGDRLVKLLRKAALSKHPFSVIQPCSWRGTPEARGGCSRIERAFCKRDGEIRGFEDCILCLERKERGMSKRGNKDRLAPCVFAKPGRKIRRSCRKITQYWQCSQPDVVALFDADILRVGFPRKHCETQCKYLKKP